MSIPVPIPDLVETLARYDLAFLVTVSAAMQPRFLAQRPAVEQGEGGPVLVISKAGPGTRSGATRGPISLLYPNADPTKHSLIVDGTADLRGEDIVFTPEAAILHIPR